MAHSDDQREGRGHSAGRDRSRGGSTRDYEVGYGKPPVHSRWQKGQSGNPRGRPRKSDIKPFAQRVYPVRDLILEELERPVEVREGGRTVELETLRAIARSVMVGAIRGNRSQQKLALEYASAAEESRKSDMRNLVETVEAYKARWGPVFDMAQVHRGREPSQLPHPDHVNIDPYSGELVFSGPQTQSDKEAWDFLKWQLRETQKLIDKFRAEAAANPGDRQAAGRVELLEERLRQREERDVPPGWNWREEFGWEEAYGSQKYEEFGLDSSIFDRADTRSR